MKTVYENARIVDGTGSAAVEDGLLVVEDNRILFAGPKGEVDTAGADQRVDCKGYTLLPGLFNIHCHLDLGGRDTTVYDSYGTPAYRSLVSYRRLAEALECGITTVRPTGSPDGTDFALKKAIDKGLLWGSRIVTCGMPLIAIGGHGGNGWGVRLVAGVDSCIAAVREQIANGAEFIKMIATGGMAGEHEKPADQQMLDEEIIAIIRVAHSNGRRVTAHMGGDHAIRVAVENGLDAIEHAYSMEYDTAKLAAERGVYLTPTFIISQGYDVFEERGSSPHMLNRVREFGISHQTVVKDALRAGVQMCIGTDWLPSDPMRGSNATMVEMELLADVAGMSPLEVIKAATHNSADNCGILPITGTLEAGKEADVIAVQGKPDEDIHDIRKLGMVMKGGAIAWSTIAGYEQRGLGIVRPGTPLEGGAMVSWL